MKRLTHDELMKSWCLAKKSGRNHKKRHGVNQERSYIERRRYRIKKQKLDTKQKKMKRYHAKVRQFWLGEIDVFPEKPYK